MGDQPSHEVRGGVRIHRVRSALYRARGLIRGGERPQAPPAPDPQTVLDLRRVLGRERPEVVHGHNWLVHSYLPLDRKRAPALVVSLHDYGLLCATKRLRHRDRECSGPGPLKKCMECARVHYQGAKGIPIAVGMLTSGPLLRRRADLFLAVSQAVRDRSRLSNAERCRVIPNLVRPRDGGTVADPRLKLPAA